jgi:predicted MFS family arabinose efflux permease
VIDPELETKPAPATSRAATVDRFGLALSPVLVACIIQGLCSMALGSRALLIPLRAVELGGTRAEVGLVFAVWTCTAAITSIPGAAAIGRWGLRWTLAAALGTYIVSQAIPGLFDQFYVLVISMALGGVAAALAQNGLMTWLTGQGSGGVARSIGWYTLSMQLGQTLGPAAAGVLLNWLTIKQTFLVTAAAIVPSFAFLALAPAAGAMPGAGRFAGRTLDLVRRQGMTRIVVVFLATAMAWGVFQSYYALFTARGLGLSATVVGFLIGLSAIVGAVSRIPSGRLLDRVPGREPIALILSTAGVGVTLIVLPHAGSALGAGLVAVFFAPLFAVAQLAAAVGLASRAPAANRVSALGIYTLVFNLGWGVGAVIFAPFMQAGYLAGFSAAGSCCVLVATGAVLGLRHPFAAAIAPASRAAEPE